MGERHVHLQAHAILVGIEAELAELGLHALLGETLHRALVAQPVADEIRDGADLEPVAARKLLQLRPARHAAVIVHDLAQHPGGLQAGEAAQVDRRLGVPGAHQHAAAARTQREDMSGTGEVGGSGGGIRECPDGGRAVARGHPGGRAGAQVDRYGEGGAVRLAVDRDHLRQLQARELLLFHRHADDAAGVADHEGHRLGSRMFGGHDEVALVLPVLVVHDDDHASGAQFGEDFPERAERGGSTGGCRFTG